MQNIVEIMFRPKNKVLLFTFIVIAIIATVVLFDQSRLQHPLLPVSGSAYPLTVVTSSDAKAGGASTITINDASQTLDFNFKLTSDFQFPYASLGIFFTENAQENDLADWSRYSTITFKVRCDPNNMLSLALNTFDSMVTDPNVFSTFRPSITVFSCDKNWRELSIDLRRLNTPEWWLIENNLELNNKDYALDKIYSFSIVNTTQSAVGVNSNVKIAQATLVGRAWLPFYAACATGILLCGVFGSYLLQRHKIKLVTDIRNKIQQDQPLVAYRQLPLETKLETKKDRDKNAVLRFMATEYTNPDLSLDMVISSLGVNRAKINDILREKQGLTFSTYLNKLRLTEASRLLQKKNASVAEVAYSVGYRNVSYFNRVFKKEYGCTPNSFKKYISTEKNTE